MNSVVSALSDSGVEGNFIHAQFVDQLQIPVMPLKTPLQVSALDRELVGTGSIMIRTELIKLKCLLNGCLEGEYGSNAGCFEEIKHKL